MRDNGSLFEDIRALCEIPGVSGREEKVREYIESRIPEGVFTKTDALGNLYVFKPGKQKSQKTIMVCAHMDEVGLIITYITEDGYLKFDELGGIDPAVLIGRTVVLESGIKGVIALKHIHLCSGSESSKIPTMKEMYIDIGAKNREEAEKYVSLGSFATFQSDYVEFGEDSIKMKALDDRVGCAIMLSLINSDIPFDVQFVFTVQEEVGARGASAAAFNVRPQISVILETTTAGDICGVEGEKRACVLGDGPVVSYMDRGTVYDMDLYRAAMVIGKSAGIPVQTKTLVAGGNDSKAVQREAGGSRVIAVSVPTRYLHSPSCVLTSADVENTLKLVTELLPVIEEMA